MNGFNPAFRNVPKHSGIAGKAPFPRSQGSIGNAERERSHYATSEREPGNVQPWSEAGHVACTWCGGNAVGAVLGELDQSNRYFCALHDGAWRTDLLQEAASKEREKEMVTRNTKATATGGGDYELPDEGFHEAVIAKVVEEAPPWANGESRVKWQFELNNGDIVLIAWNGLSWSDGSNTRSGNPAKNYEWASAVLGKLPEEFDDQDLVGRKCRILVVHNPGKGQNEGKTFANVQKVGGLEGKVAKTVKAAPVPVPAGAASEDEAPF